MNAIDIGIAVIVFASVLLAFWKGFIQQAISLVGWLAALFAARLLGPELAPHFDVVIAEPGLQLAMAYVSIAVVVLLASKVLSSAFGTLIQKIGLGSVDKFFGVFFGLFRGVVIVVLLVAITSLTELRNQPMWQESQLLPYMEQIRDWTAGYLEDYSKR
ncbi:MAG: CvpA family protein [Pseudomonadaceae bacterium]|nr:CvpA family protein [Pseudomonadaceae bacterium]